MLCKCLQNTQTLKWDVEYYKLVQLHCKLTNA